MAILMMLMNTIFGGAKDHDDDDDNDNQNVHNDTVQ